jgi:N-acetylglucosaminyl-diphospho-decaprenol L-rhamnosyltransferase
VSRAGDESGTVAVVTIVHGRHDHLAGQVWGLHRQTRRPDLHVVVAMDDDRAGCVARDAADGRWPVEVASAPIPQGRLPLAAARNTGVDVARRGGADVLVLLDVDCIPCPTLVERYVSVVRGTVGSEPAGAGPVVACGEVRYLDAATTALPGSERTWPALDAGSRSHPARPAPGRWSHAVVPAHDLRLFWSLSFAVTPADWDRIGGFDDSYVGYGAEDTDFGQRLGAAGGRTLWVGGATAYHQHHGGSGGPPVEHVADVVENANRFAARWGWWPMEGWLEAFRAQGLVTRRPDGRWALVER